MKWITKNTDRFDELYDKLNDFYDKDGSILEENAGYEWTISSYDENFSNLSAVKLLKRSDEIVIKWETANKAYLIDERIEKFGKVTLESKTDLDNILNMYNQLDEDYIKYVEKYEQLQKLYDDYYLLYVDYFDTSADDMNKNTDAATFDTAYDFLEEYDALDEQYKK